MRRSPLALCTATVLSGGAALVFQTLWIRAFELILGSTVYAAAAVFAAFLTGLALGAGGAGRLASRTVDPNPPGETGHLDLTTTFAYDAAGRLVAETDPLGRTTTHAYDAAGRLVGKELPNGGVWTYGYDAVGNQTSATDPLSQTTTSAYDAVNRLVSVIDPLGHATTYGYDADGRRTSVTDPLGITTERR